MLTQGRGKRGEEIKKRKIIIIKKLGSKVERFYEKFREVLLFFFFLSRGSTRNKFKNGENNDSGLGYKCK